MITLAESVQAQAVLHSPDHMKRVNEPYSLESFVEILEGTNQRGYTVAVVVERTMGSVFFCEVYLGKRLRIFTRQYTHGKLPSDSVQLQLDRPDLARFIVIGN